MSDYILEMKNITKLYPGVVALDDVSIQVRKGSVHALVGENGAGKSTLIKTLAGAITPDGGKIVLDGEEFDGLNPDLAIQKGVGVVYQEFNLVPQLTVADNIFFKRELKKNKLILDTAKMNRLSQEYMDEFGLGIDVKSKVCDLSVAYQQLVEIVKVASKDAKVMVMDEPSAPLTNQELKHLFALIEKLKAKGVTIIYISHRLEEIFEICDTVSVLRDGKHIITMPVAETNQYDLIKYMVGHSMDTIFPERNVEIGDVVLKADHLYNEKLRDVSFELHKGEVLGIAGLVGAGRTELARALFGADELLDGEIIYNGEKIANKSCKEAINRGFGLVPEDRKAQGTILHMTVDENICFACYDRHTSLGIVLKEKELAGETEKFIKELNIKTPSSKQVTRNLSGGNQQKVVVAKWLATHSDIIIFDEPTRGIDVGAKSEIYSLINDLVAQGKSIIMISSEMPELIGMSDRMLVMCEGRVSGELQKSEFDQVKILELASGVKNKVS